MRVDLSRDASKFLSKCPQKSRLEHKIKGLSGQAVSKDSVFLGRVDGYPNFRIRVGNYRIVYLLMSDRILVTIIDKRSRVYKR